MVTKFRINFHVPGNPVPKQRARANPGGKAYYAKRPRGSKRLSYPEYKELVQSQCLELGPMVMMHREPHTWGIRVQARLGRGDADNVLGSIMDALNGILWKDDSQVLQASVTLERVGPKEPRGVDVECWVIA